MRRDRGYLREQRDRVVRKRIRQARRHLVGVFAPLEPLVGGRMENEQHYMGCHRARCGLCDPRNWGGGASRQASERDALRHEERGG